MMNTDTPRLCGGTFFVLLLREKRKTRTRKQLQNFGSDGLTNVGLMKHLIQLSDADCLPFNDNTLVNSFDQKIKSSYEISLFRMGEISDFFLKTDKEDKMRELVYSILTVIKNDETIKSDNVFYATEDGVAVSKAKMLAMTDINVPALLLGVWHYILRYRKDNTLGAATIAEWHTAPQEKGDRHSFTSTVGSSFDHEIKISTDYESIDDANQDVFKDIYEEPQTENTAESEPFYEQSQPAPTINQAIQNQFNFYQTGNGINIGHADTVELKGINLFVPTI